MRQFKTEWNSLIRPITITGIELSAKQTHRLMWEVSATHPSLLHNCEALQEMLAGYEAVKLRSGTIHLYEPKTRHSYDVIDVWGD